MRRPGRYWRRFAERRAEFAAVQPNAAHRALADFVAATNKSDSDRQVMLTTTNIDNLHRRAGSQNVVELHGNAFYLRCLDYDCELPPERDEIDPDLAATAPMPRRRPVRKPDAARRGVFGEGAPEKWSPVREFAAAGEVDVAVVIGLSGW